MRPKSFLLATWGAPGDFGPMLTAARRLRDRGHMVRMLGDSFLEAQSLAWGIAFQAWQYAPSVTDRVREIPDDPTLPPRFAAFRGLCKQFMFSAAADYARDTMTELAREPTDAVIALDLLFGVAIAAEASSIPCAFFSPHISIEPLPGMPPGGQGLLPPTNAIERATNETAAVALRDDMNTHLATLNATRAQFRLPALDHVFDQYSAGGRLLLALSPAFDFAPSQLPSHVRYVGPLLDDTTWARRWISPFKDRPALPLVLVAFGTSVERETVVVLQRVIDALGKLKVHGVVTLGAGLAGTVLYAPVNVAILPSANHDSVMRDASLLITHGGLGTVTRALIHNLPTLILPIAHDQYDNAARVVARGAGLSLDADSSPATISLAIRRLLDEPSFKAAAANLGNAVAFDVALPTFVEEIEAIAARSIGAFRRDRLAATDRSS